MLGMLLPRALSQSLLIVAVFALVLISSLNANAADATTRKSTSYHQQSERLIFYPANLGFGSVDAGTQKLQTITITNGGNSEITLLQAIGQGSDFSLAGLDFPLTLAGGASFTFTVVFAPQAPGESNGSVSFISAKGGASSRIPLTGSATEAPAIGVTVQGHKVDLSWRASNSKGVIGYNIYRAQKSTGPYRKINSTLDGSTAYTDTSVVNGATYYYATTAVNSKERESVYSNKARAKIP